MTDQIPDRGHNNPPELLPVLPITIEEEEARKSIEKQHVDAEPLPYDPVVHETLRLNVEAFCDAAGAWLDLKTINSTAQSERLTDFVAGSRGLYKKVDTARDAAKRPYDEKGDKVQKAFKPLMDKVEKIGKAMKVIQADWLEREERRIEAEKRAAREAAEKAQAEADALAAQAAARNDISGQVDAEASQKEAEALAKAANRKETAKAGSATGGGRTMALRTQKYAEVTNWNMVLLHFKNDQRVRDLLQSLADAEARAGVTVPGTETKERKVAA